MFFSFTALSRHIGAYVMANANLSRLLSPAKISTGKLMFRMLLPDSRFFPILVKINFSTPFWSWIFFSSMKMMPPALSKIH